jgi:hypothetical protein
VNPYSVPFPAAGCHFAALAFDNWRLSNIKNYKNLSP